MSQDISFKKVKILVLNPVATEVWNKTTKNALARVASPRTEVEVRSLPEGPNSIESVYDASIASKHVVSEVIKAESEGFDAVVINCFDDPGLDAAREVSNILILGAGETSLTVATLLGHRIGIISTGPNTPALYHRRMMELGMVERLAYTGYVELGVLDLRKDEDRLMELLVREGGRAIDMGAEVIVLGCTGFVGLAHRLSMHLEAPVIDPALTSFKIAEALASIGMRHSKKHLYNIPRHKLSELLFSLGIEGKAQESRKLF
jgi:allantoin racemase